MTPCGSVNAAGFSNYQIDVISVVTTAEAAIAASITAAWNMVGGPYRFVAAWPEPGTPLKRAILYELVNA